MNFNADNIKCVIFDLDGTLIDSKHDIANAVKYALKKIGTAPPDERKIYDFIGHGVHHLLYALIPAEKRVFLDNALFYFREYYSNHLLDNTKLYPGIKEFLILLDSKHKAIAVASNKPTIFVRQILEGLEVASLFSVLIGAEDNLPRKPAPDMVFEIIKKSGAEKDSTILIGDSEVDIETARNAELKIIAVTYGLRSREEIIKYNPDFIFETTRQIIEFFTNS